ncbi:4-hydroxythreonine-4-phosphate dehydrogenase PdxA [Croceicoccus sp. F390]|uniref:4-hydroxythreonine-4-phosphate dehydrogenase n=1 Tax=Croceicoccus esteveae TaxID=3075597 RepID=A0ABU2ZIH7_9SPHN|nr:4-hydroxythreonine-4-phosphate dehydrogenase PdxA [Croceicoccus sp. F390]MDT0575384.1 4-hydroxythreonine-4-phosphate dehydrogenase PdxA [Croceicoccus sp. F390]
MIARPLPPLVATMGDPAGVGPELLVRAWENRHAANLPPFFVVGSASVLRDAARQLDSDAPIVAVDNADEAVEHFATALPVLDLASGSYAPGCPTREGAIIARDTLAHACDLVLAGTASGLVTGPIAKAAMQEIGFAGPGQTEFVAQACGVAPADAVMMLAGPSLRVLPLTVHVALEQVPQMLDRQLIERRITIAAAALSRDFGIDRPRIAVAGLNPHAGEQGQLGQQEVTTIAPAIATLRAAGIDATGPFAADTMFHAAGRARYDLAACMYHDQALIPLKALHFDEGVNVTLGLPIVRTSPDHGTAFSIAGLRKASAGPTLAALKMAGEIARRRTA